MKLSELLHAVKATQVIGNPELKDISYVTSDSRKVKNNTLFIAITGFVTDGHNYIQSAISNGASAIVIENDDLVSEQIIFQTDCVLISVKNSRRALAEASNILYGEPSKKLKLFGVTGTKGKTTTSFYLKQILETAGYKTGLIGTIKNYVGENVITAERTTPESNLINRLLTEMIDEGCKHCVMEVSSHALDLNRVDCLDFDFAIFTNFTSDHLDYHKTVDEYLNAKKIFFDMLKPEATAVFNFDDESNLKLLKDTKAEQISYGQSREANFRINDIDFNLNGTTFNIEYDGRSFPIRTSLAGHFNAYNAAAAFTVAVLTGINPETASQGIRETPQVPGRFEVISRGNKKIIIDYSHTSDSLKQALTAIHHTVKNERPIYTVFGCGGDRDKSKRPLMGEIADTMSDKIIITSDNPRTEDPYKIIDDILKGVKSSNAEVIENRDEAIKKAVYDSEDDAVILIAGKGHEDYQDRNGIKKRFSDKETAEKYLNECQNQESH